jgi:hypothetical protein
MIGGRSAWIAWPAGVLCAGVVVTLAVIAAPAVPAAVQFVAVTLQAGAVATAETPDAVKPLAQIGPVSSDDCRELYPAPLWMQLTFDPDVVLSQNQSPPATEVPGLVGALSPKVRMTCSWRTSTGETVSTTLADVTAPASTAQAALVAAGFACDPSGAGVRCVRTSGGTVEDHVVRDGVWLETTERGWRPVGYLDELVERLWPDATSG